MFFCGFLFSLFFLFSFFFILGLFCLLFKVIGFFFSFSRLFSFLFSMPFLCLLLLFFFDSHFFSSSLLFSYIHPNVYSLFRLITGVILLPFDWYQFLISFVLLLFYPFLYSINNSQYPVFSLVSHFFFTIWLNLPNILVFSFLFFSKRAILVMKSSFCQNRHVFFHPVLCY